MNADRERAEEHLFRKARELHHTVGTGFFGTGLLNQALTHMGQTEDAYKLMLQTQFPSCAVSGDAGAATILEHWMPTKRRVSEDKMP